MFIVFDTETTGLTKHPSVDQTQQPRIIEFGAAVFDQNGVRIREYNQLINPGQTISAEITKITGITNEALADKPRFCEVWDDIARQFEGANFVISHNLPFDRALVAFEIMRMARQRGDTYTLSEAIHSFKEWPAAGEICTAEMFQGIWGYRPKLRELFEWSLGRPLAQTHRALDDVNALVEVIQKENIFGALAP